MASTDPPAAASSQQRPRRRRALADDVGDLLLHDFIVSGRVPAGGLLPSENELSRRYGVSRPTVRSAIRSLREHGLVSVRNGVGAIVLPPSPVMTHGLDRLASIDTFAREAGARIGTAELEWTEEPADAAASAKLRLPIGDPVLVVRRCKVFDGTRVAWISDVFPATLVDRVPIEQEFRGSVLDVLLAHPELDVEYADSEISPVALEQDIARPLRVAPGTLALCLDSTVYTAEGSPILWGLIWLLPEHFRFSFRRRQAITG